MLGIEWDRLCDMLRDILWDIQRDGCISHMQFAGMSMNKGKAYPQVEDKKVKASFHNCSRRVGAKGSKVKLCQGITCLHLFSIFLAQPILLS